MATVSGISPYKVDGFRNGEPFLKLEPLSSPTFKRLNSSICGVCNGGCDAPVMRIMDKSFMTIKICSDKCLEMFNPHIQYEVGSRTLLQQRVEDAAKNPIKRESKKG